MRKEVLKNLGLRCLSLAGVDPNRWPQPLEVLGLVNDEDLRMYDRQSDR